jgi:hypothetical protein
MGRKGDEDVRKKEEEKKNGWEKRICWVFE